MANESALALVQRLCYTRGLPAPSAVVGATDPGVIQMRALLEEEVSELVTYYDWQATRQFFTFSTLAQQQQGAVDGGIPGSTTQGYQVVNVHGAKSGSSSTGLANAATVYTATITVSGTAYPITVTGSAAQTYTNLITQINADLTGATAAVTDGNIKITVTATGVDSTISIVDGTTNPLFATLTDYAFIGTAVNGSNPFIPSSAGFWRIWNDTLWDVSRRLPLFGPRKPQDIAMLLAIPVTGPFLQFDIWDNQLNIIPTPAAGDQIIGFFQSKFGWTASTGLTFSQYLAADTDFPRLDSQLVFLGLKWRWLQAKGLAFTAAQMEYETRKAQLIAGDRPRTKKSLSGTTAGYFDPVVVMPAGSWPAQT